MYIENCEQTEMSVYWSSKQQTWIFRSLLRILRSMCKLKCLCTDHRDLNYERISRSTWKKKVRHGNLTALSAHSSLGNGERERRDCPSYTYSPGRDSQTVSQWSQLRAGLLPALLSSPASLSGLAETMCSTRMTPDSIWFFATSRTFRLPFGCSGVWMTDWENRLLEKHLQVVLRDGCLPQATGKAVQSACSSGPKGMYIVPPSSEDRWRGRDHKRCGYKVTCSTTVRVCCFWLIGVFCVFAQCWLKGLLPAHGGSCLIQSWIISSVETIPAEWTEPSAGGWCKKQLHDYI